MYQYKSSERVILPNFQHGWYIIYKLNGKFYIKPRKEFPVFSTLILDEEK